MSEISARKQKILVGRRRARVLEMYNRGATQQEMADAMGVGQSTISRDIQALNRDADRDVEDYYKNLALESYRIMSGVDSAVKQTWKVLDDASLTNRERMAAVSLLLKCYGVREEWLPRALSARKYSEQYREMLADIEKKMAEKKRRRPESADQQGLADPPEQSGEG